MTPNVRHDNRRGASRDETTKRFSDPPIRKYYVFPSGHSVHAGAHVYVFDCGAAVKVGKTGNPLLRARDVRASGCRPDLEIVATWPFHTDYDAAACEREVHELLWESRVIGEWFQCRPDEAVSAVQSVMRRHGWDGRAAAESVAA